MKFKKLLVLSALWLAASSVMAAIVDGVRVKPAPSATQGFVASESTDQYYYLYNVDAQAFFTEGNSWGTQVSLGSTGLKVAFTVDDVYPDAYLFNDFSIAKNAWKLVFFDNENQMFVDLGSQANYRWGVEENGETFRLYAASDENGNPGWDEGEKPAYREGFYMGWVKGSSGSACVPYLADEEGNCINWTFVTEDVYNVLVEEIAVYEAAEKLKKAIDDAKAKGFTETATFETLYANEDATKAELEKGLAELNDVIVEWGKNNATVENPADMTAKIVNPRFDGDDLKTGWSTAFNANGGKENAEYWNMNYNTHQDIVGLPEGVYTLGVNAFYRAGSNGSTAIQNWLAHNEASKYAKLYATAGENTRETSLVNVFSGAQAESQGVGDVEVKYTDPETQEEVSVWVPNNMVAAEYFMHTLGQYANKLLFSVGEGQTVTIGVKKDINISDEWSIFDDFTLTYYGKGADAYQLMLDEALKDYGEVTIDEGTVYTEALLDAYKAALAGEKTATNQAEVDAIFNKIDGAYNELQKNIELWKTYQKTCEDSFEKYCKDDASYNPDICLTVGDLSDYVANNVKYVGEDELDGYETTLNEHKLNNEELQAEIDYVNALCDQIDKEAKEGLKEGDDVTRFLKNADFESGVKRGAADPNGNTGDYGTAVSWHADKFANGNFTPGPDGKDNDPTVNHAFEAWHCHDFDFWQEVDNLQEGVYVINVQGYVRNETGPNGSTVVDYDPSIIPIKLYMNNSTSNFPDVFSEEVPENKYDEDGNLPMIEDWSWSDMNGSKYANSMGAAGMCFDWGMYKVRTYGLVKAGEKMRIGVKGKMTGDWWCIWDNFKLTYQGYNVEYVKPALDEAMASIDVTKPMGKNVYDTAKGLADKAAEAKASGDGKTMFQMLADVYDASAAIISSVQLFETLTDAIENEATGLQAAIYTSANDKAKAEAEALVGTITSGMENHDINDDEVAGLLEQIANMKTKLAMPADWESATDDNSADFTSVIVNPAYDEGVSGWSGTGAAWSDSGLNAEIFGKDYDYYQDIIGLPAGTYEVTVQGFYRAGDASTDYNTWVETPDENNNAYLYAAYINGTDTVVSSVPLKRLAAEAESEADGAYLEDGYVYAKNPSEEGAGDGWIVPNNMTTASYEFDKEKYNNKVIVKLGSDDATLRIGLKKEVNLENNWSIWDNWHINYFGKASSKEADGDAATAISTMEAAVAPVKVEFFTIDGRKAIRAQKGVILQKTTLSNGATIIKKIMK